MKIIHFADLHLGVENWGRTDPDTGVSSRTQDILSAFDELVDYAIREKVDLVLFCGDAYKSREPSQTQQREFAKRIAKLSDACIPVFLLTGNHDLPNAVGRATSTEIFNTLSVKNVSVASKPCIQVIETAGGPIQIVALPWIRRAALLSRDDNKNLTFEQINQKLQKTLTDIIEEQASKLDLKTPAILAAHVWVANATTGTESSMTIGQEHTLLLSNLRHPGFDYVALGHIHKRQVLGENPPVIYSGSLQRLDFGDEHDEKGFYLVNIDTSAGTKKVSMEFHPVNTRRFLTIPVNLQAGDLNPTGSVITVLDQHKSEIKDAVVRVQLGLPQELEPLLDDGAIRAALGEAHTFIISRDVQRSSRTRLGGLNMEQLKPSDMLKLYLESKKEIKDKEKVLEYGQRLIEEESTK